MDISSSGHILTKVSIHLTDTGVDDFKQTPWPIKKGPTPVVAFIPEYGVTMWANDNNKNIIVLYKHDQSADLEILDGTQRRSEK